jgi:hypothetical protein
MSLMIPHIQTPSVIPKLILSLCLVSIATCNEFFEIMSPFNVDKIRPSQLVKAGNKTIHGILILMLLSPV